MPAMSVSPNSTRRVVRNVADIGGGASHRDQDSLPLSYRGTSLLRKARSQEEASHAFLLASCLPHAWCDFLNGNLSQCFGANQQDQASFHQTDHTGTSHGVDVAVDDNTAAARQGQIIRD